MEIKENMIELMIVILLFFGLFLSLTAGTAILNYIIIILCGLFFGRKFYLRKTEKKLMLAFYFSVGAFLIGYIIGGYYANSKIILLLFLFGFCISYWIHAEFIKI